MFFSATKKKKTFQTINHIYKIVWLDQINFSHAIELYNLKENFSKNYHSSKKTASKFFTLIKELYTVKK